MSYLSILLQYGLKVVKLFIEEVLLVIEAPKVVEFVVGSLPPPLAEYLGDVRRPDDGNALGGNSIDILDFERLFGHLLGCFLS